MENNRLRPIHFLIIALCCLSVFGSIGIANAYGLFYTPMTEIWDLPRSQATFHVTIQSLVSGFATPLVVRLSRKIKMRYIFLFGVCLYLAVGYGIATASSIMWVNVLGFLKGIANSCISMVFVTLAINNWFVRYKGTIVGIVLSSSGFGGAIVSPILQNLLNSHGFRYAFLACTIGTVLCCLPFAIICPMTPQQYGLEPFGAGYKDEKKKTIRNLNMPFTIRGPYLILVISAMASTASLSLSSHLPSFAIEKGFDAATGASQLSFIMIGNVASKFIMGVVVDRFGPFFGYLSGMILCLGGIAAIMLNNSSPALYVISGLLYGFGYSVGTVVITNIYSYFYGLEGYAEAYSNSTLVTSIYSSVLFIMVNALYDGSGSYQMPFVILTALSVVGILSILRARRYARACMEKKNA